MLGCAKKAFTKIVLVFLATLSCPVLAEDLLWTNGSGNGLWGISNNWSPARLPSLDGDTARINSLPGPLIDDVDGECQWLILSDGASASLNMTSGTLFIFDFVTFADDSGFIIANTPAGAGTFTLDGGLVRTGPGSNVYVGYKGQGTIFMNGGTFEIQGLLGIGYCDTGISTGRGCVYLDGGTITAADFQMASPAGCTGLLDISGGTLIVDGDKTSLINGYIADGRIVAYDGTGVVAVDYNITNLGQTTVRSLIDPRQAANPNPAHNEASVPLDVNFSWTGGVGATSHRVYFGAASPGTFQGEQDANSYNPPVLDGNTTYYWRVDEVVGANTVTGVVWKFTTDDGLAKNPDPANATGGVAADEVLHWTAGSGATSHDVYFGTDAAAVAAAQRLAGDLDASGQVDFNDVLILISRWQADPAGSVPYAGVNDDNLVDFNDYALLAQNWMAKSSSVFRGNVTVASYEPDLVQDCNYYWRIDEVCGAKRRKGNVWSFTTYYSLVGKVMCGYQGWFNTSTDGASRNWRHWPDNGTTAPTPTNIHVDMWPDMTEMDADEKYEATAFAGGSNHYYLFSSRNLKTVRRHFKWMQDYGVDGVYLQRFATEVINQGDSSFTNRNYVLDYCKDGANMYGRKYAIMYDLTGLDLGKMQKVMDDWKYLVNTKQVTRDPADYAYMRHRGKPVVAVWGIGFTDRKYTWAECLALVNFLHDDPVYGNNIVIIGVNDSWRSYITDPTMAAIATKADIISPWSVGRYKYPGELTNFTNNVWVPDMLWCQTNSTPSHPIEYLPVIWPGFSWQNMHADVQPPDSPDNYPLNQYPRNGGQFLWDQVNKTVGTAHANMLYIAMFDEVDEGTAIFKVTNNPPRPGGVDMFVTYEGLPSDEYLWLTGQAGKALRGEIPVSIARPNR